MLQSHAIGKHRNNKLFLVSADFAWCHVRRAEPLHFLFETARVISCALENNVVIERHNSAQIHILTYAGVQTASVTFPLSALEGLIAL